ncbi:MAG: hypothetical protein KBC26_01695 [Candidatus Pacebacteria bacterium]|nr:hypothetical protein [Candidatus Paceibacterota bacterium]
MPIKFEHGSSNNESRQHQERSPEYLKILGELEQIIDAPEEEQKEFIERRLAFLSKNAESGEISHISRQIHAGFLGPDMKIRRSMIVDPFVVNDPSLYTHFLKTIKTFRTTRGWEEKTLREIVPFAIQWSLSEYFGNATANQDTEVQNREFYLEHTSAESQPISIKELKGREFAVCAEKAAVAQNLLAFVGMEADLIASASCRIVSEGEDGAHYYILIHGPKGDIIYDPTNPRLLLDRDRKLISYSPAVYPISEEQSQQLTSGGSIQVEHIDNKTNENNQQLPERSMRLYAGPLPN